MQLLFIPEFASQQLCRVVGDFPQPLLQGLALFAVEAGRHRALWRLDDTVVAPGLVAGAAWLLLLLSPGCSRLACWSSPGVPWAGLLAELLLPSVSLPGVPWVSLLAAAVAVNVSDGMSRVPLCWAYTA
jgi:hypothetical protein